MTHGFWSFHYVSHFVTSMSHLYSEKGQHSRIRPLWQKNFYIVLVKVTFKYIIFLFIRYCCIMYIIF